jgi:hypothetical protein
VATITIEDWKPLNKGQLPGFTRVLLPSGLILVGCPVGLNDKGAWASPPARPQIGKDGEVLRKSSGKIKYSPVIDFASREIRRRWSDAVIAALRASHPEALS